MIRYGTQNAEIPAESSDPEAWAPYFGLSADLIKGLDDVLTLIHSQGFEDLPSHLLDDLPGNRYHAAEGLGLQETYDELNAPEMELPPIVGVTPLPRQPGEPPPPSVEDTWSPARLVFAIAAPQQSPRLARVWELMESGTPELEAVETLKTDHYSAQDVKKTLMMVERWGWWATWTSLLGTFPPDAAELLKERRLMTPETRRLVDALTRKIAETEGLVPDDYKACEADPEACKQLQKKILEAAPPTGETTVPTPDGPKTIRGPEAEPEPTWFDDAYETLKGAYIRNQIAKAAGLIALVWFLKTLAVAIVEENAKR